MRVMVVEVGPEIEQLVFEVCRRPEQHVIQVFPPQRLVEPVKRIIVGAEVVRHPALPSNGAVEHPTQHRTIDRPRMDAEPNDSARVLIHDKPEPSGSARWPTRT